MQPLAPQPFGEPARLFPPFLVQRYAGRPAAQNAADTITQRMTHQVETQVVTGAQTVPAMDCGAVTSRVALRSGIT